ncbi:MAG: M48 family metalloprotease [Hyphomicrobiales bacterium]|nr:M48 family metalloprotease [Hyphomicrobiales bacterium]
MNLQTLTPAPAGHGARPWRGANNLAGLGRGLARLALAGVIGVQAAVAAAQDGKPLPLIRDAETETLIREYATPIFRAAGVTSSSVHIYLINDPVFNAFVADGQRMFINTGTLMQTDTPNELIGVIAHETGHIAGGHLARLQEEVSRLQTASIIALLAGIGAFAAGGGQAGQAVMMGGQNAILHQLLAARRVDESAADRAAVRFLAATGQSVQGMVQTFRRFAEQALLTARFADPYLQSHPMPRERLSALEDAARRDPYANRKDPQQLQLRHDLVRAKLSAYLERPDTVTRRYPGGDNSLPARYARAIQRYLGADLRGAVAEMDGLIAAMPDYPYFWELKGQALLETGQPREAVAPLKKAVSLAPSAGLIRMLYGQALLATGDRANLDTAIGELKQATDREPEAIGGLRQLAIAYGQKGDIVRADMVSARANFVAGDFELAKKFAARVQHRAPMGSPLWLQADDIISFKPPQ